jgi:hypothetical protein
MQFRVFRTRRRTVHGLPSWNLLRVQWSSRMYPVHTRGAVSKHQWPNLLHGLHACSGELVLYSFLHFKRLKYSWSGKCHVEFSVVRVRVSCTFRTGASLRGARAPSGVEQQTNQNSHYPIIFTHAHTHCAPAIHTHTHTHTE